MAVHDLDQRSLAVFALARGYTTDKAGEEAGVSGRTIRRWREDPTFEADVAAARRAILDAVVAALGAACQAAVTALHDALSDESTSVRVRAASVLLGALPNIAQYAELESRIAALEAGLQERNAA